MRSLSVLLTSLCLVIYIGLLTSCGSTSSSSNSTNTGSPNTPSAGARTDIVTNGANVYATADGGTNLDIFSLDQSSGALTLANTTSALTGDPNHLDSAGGLALDHTGGSLYVAVGVGDFDGGFNVFTVGSSPSAQQLQYLQISAYMPSPLVFSPNNQYGYTDFCTVRTDGMATDGSLKSINVGTVPGPRITGVGFCPEALAATPKGYLAVVWFPFAFGSSVPSNQPYVMTYTINSDGTLTAVSGSQVPTASTSANKVAANFDPSGSVLAVAGDGGIQTFALNSNGILTSVGSPQNAGANFQSVQWDNSNHLFAAKSTQLYVFSSSNGILAPAPGSPYAGGPELAVLPHR